jgi:hypothetical protein
MPKPSKGTARKGGRPRTVIDGEQVTVRLDRVTLNKIAKVLEHARFGTQAQVLREAISIGIEQILLGYER